VPVGILVSIKMVTLTLFEIEKKSHRGVPDKLPDHVLNVNVYTPA
jgi:hypothetical protein